MDRIDIGDVVEKGLLNAGLVDRMIVKRLVIM